MEPAVVTVELGNAQRFDRSLDMWERNVPVTTTRPVGTLIAQTLNGQEQWFELTNVRLHDGTFAAEPIDRCRSPRR
ncbi:hypothetical protein JK364_50530 [Streptomyces sp. 110]|uniref:Uncharacterized protein n=1 Tax=Streptomyces endocoffeicus TaxID=2898945 RepID=A0ABS1Q987_9ACTN|nr:hypothetical protein [Streptomyces endocoffeicus]MBL1120476.1 hypothetical protein [Streptomyces endocoffeicus]